MFKKLASVGAATVGVWLWAQTAVAEEPGPKEPAYLYRANVINIVDGDTIDVDIDLGFYVWIKDQRIRLVGINSPEPRGETEQAGKAATECLSKLIVGKTIIIRTVKGKDGGDRDDSFGRWLGVVYLDGLDINNLMLEKGCAVTDARP